MMPLSDDLKEHRLGKELIEAYFAHNYHLMDNKVFWRQYQVRGADISTFRYYHGDFAKDQKNCYCQNGRLPGANAASFRALNFCFYTDGQSVWALGGKVQDVDASTFEVCDDGYFRIGESRVPHGYGKDRNRVFYYDFDGKPNWVRKADPKSFRSLNDGFFGVDENSVFEGAYSIAKARVNHWRKLGGHFSCDDRRVFYCRREIEGADLETFQVFEPYCDNLQVAKDKNYYYWNDTITEAPYLHNLIKRSSPRLLPIIFPPDGSLPSS